MQNNTDSTKKEPQPDVMLDSLTEQEKLFAEALKMLPGASASVLGIETPSISSDDSSKTTDHGPTRS
jgi:hypothetical protein